MNTSQRQWVAGYFKYGQTISEEEAETENKDFLVIDYHSYTQKSKCNIVFPSPQQFFFRKNHNIY